MKKPTPKKIGTKLDKVCSEIIRTQGYCSKCGADYYAHLDCAHFFSRSYHNTRWDLLNMVCLCDTCHFWAHKNPLLFAEWAKEYLGELRYQQLKISHQAIRKWSVDEMQELYTILLKTKEGLDDK